MNRISLSRLGRMGRWGNQVFQYMFLRSYAERYDLEYQAPRWVGQRLFNIDDSPLSWNLPQFDEQYDRVDHSNIPDFQDAWRYPLTPKNGEVIGYDFHGYCQFHTSYYRRHQEFLRGLFTLRVETTDRLGPITQSLSQSTVIGLHLRRGDTGRAIFYYTPNEWYLAWLERNWGRFDSPRLVIATETPSDVKAFEKYDPITAGDLIEQTIRRYDLYNYLRQDLRRPTPSSMDWFPDWYALTQCDVLLFGESTFSFSAAMLGRAKECWQSRLSTQRFRLIDPWNAPPLIREHLNDYPSIPGTRRH